MPISNVTVLAQSTMFKSGKEYAILIAWVQIKLTILYTVPIT